MKLKQVQEMNCGCSVTDGVITMCPRHEAGPKFWKAVERLLEVFERSYAETPDDPDWERRREAAYEAKEYIIPDELIGVIWDIDEILNGPIYYKLSDEAVEEMRGENQNHQLS